MENPDPMVEVQIYSAESNIETISYIRIGCFLFYPTNGVVINYRF